MADWDKTWSQHLIELRRKAGLTIEQAASAAGMSAADWTAMEQQGLAPRMRMIRPIAKALGCHAKEVF